MLKTNQSTVAMWETGSSFPRSDRLPQLAKILGCHIDDLYSEIA
ncbi:helix-turn-helix domain-containing protein [Caproiciproducens sp.]